MAVPEEPKATSPIEITIKINPASLPGAMKRPAQAVWRAVTGATARIVYWCIAGFAALFALTVAISNGVVSGRALGAILAAALAAGLIALKRRYSPLIRD